MILGYPTWAMGTFLGLGAVFAAVQAFDMTKGLGKKVSKPDTRFESFQRQYLLVYLIIQLADWLQGTHMYTLYQSYGVDISTLFLVGFASAAVFSTFIGSLIDRFGRKNGCVVYCVLEIVINIMEHSTNFQVLLLGRVLGGISTALLCSSFESWMVTEHRKQKFSEAQLERTFSLASVGNGLVAVLAGVLSEVMASYFGHIGPFQLAIALTGLALLLILTWRENFGNPDATAQDNVREGLKCILGEKSVIALGLMSSLFEGAMYTFVFMWVPTLQGLGDANSSIPTGLVFSCFMMCVSLGGSLFSVLLPCFRVEVVSLVACVLAFVALLVPVLSTNFMAVFAAFLAVEICVGMYYPSVGVMRSQLLPSHVSATLMNFFRVPLNILVVTGTKLTDTYPAPIVFAVCAGWFCLASLLQLLVVRHTSPAPEVPEGGARAAEGAKDSAPGVTDLLKRQRLVPDLATLTQVELREMCRTEGVAIRGNKAELRKRLTR